MVPVGSPRSCTAVWGLALIIVLTLSHVTAAADNESGHPNASAFPVRFRENRTLAVFIAGLRVRFIMGPFVQHVVRAAVLDGFAVHVYMSLVDFDPRNASYLWHDEWIGPDLETGNLTTAEFHRVTREAVVAAGGQVAYLDTPRKERLHALPNVTRIHLRLRQYSPYTTEVGRSILRLWQTRERMWNISRGVERAHAARYRLVAWTRDDTFWLGPIQMCAFLKLAADEALFTRNCLCQGGINDKTVVMGRRAAAEVMLAYTAFWDPRPYLEGFNAENYLLRLAQARRLAVRAVDFALLPSIDSMIRHSTRRPCVKRVYSCLLTLPPWSPEFCGPLPQNNDTNLQRWEQVWPAVPRQSHCTSNESVPSARWPIPPPNRRRHSLWRRLSRRRR